jgi:hypothetical protein
VLKGYCLKEIIPREVELEVGAIVRPEKAELKAFIEATIAKCDIQTDRLFGFYNDSLPPDEQRVGGFDKMPRLGYCWHDGDSGATSYYRRSRADATGHCLR